ncbi:Non-repetitive/WGA-negative nucleoporin C-terminal-domain-containing protein [Podospora australis]|uniref:Non-repetitive/WGA-negative nucleoporin C-terminal-domain-containing protein n=1 Tax=Podospora australis TaxID=1536484 RepID=A0AAN7AL18_9PEZI|nr:Non-repetitive/WGA-negative nucleoporin C-terminal-domain-containing protein [Podospora australis]
MFSPVLQEGGPAKGTRSSRRRQRPLSAENSVQQPKAKRQRVPLSDATIQNHDASPEMFEVKSDQIDILGAKRDGIENIGMPRKELSVRSKKPKAGDRANKGDGSIVLTTNNAYTVSKLPALPDRLRTDAQSRQQGAVYSSSGYALSLTHTHAFVWPYTSTIPSPETFTFTLPYPSKHLSDPLPLGSLVPPSSVSDEPGLVIVMPVSGKIAYWESISSAATLDFLRQQRTGVEDTISGMFSGEHVIQIVNAESTGFVLVFSSGRLAYMSVRDGHGRPGISVQFLRNGLSNNALGFFGSIRNVLSSSSSRGDIAAARASYGSKVGERVVVAATSKGRVSSWKIQRGGQHELVTDADLRERLIEAVRTADKAARQFVPESFEVLDFTFVPRDLEPKYVNSSRLSKALTQGNDEVQHGLLLVSFTDRRESRYAIVELVITADGPEVDTVRPLTSYNTPVRAGAAEKPRLYLPRPGLVAFVVFDRAVVTASMVAPPESPEAQLQDDAHILPPSFEDVIDFRDDDALQVVGSGIEEPSGSSQSQSQDEQRIHRHRTKNPAVVLLLQGVGTVRVAIADVDRFTTDTPPEVTAKSKLEQAVFFGIKGDNPLVFQGKRALPFSNTDIGNAAIELSNEIVSSKSPFIANLPVSIENNLKTRVSYLDGLIAYLKTVHVDLDQHTRWKLLYNAEKMAVAIWIWQKHEQFLAQRPKGQKTLISEIVLYINESQKTELNVYAGELDPVRHWFIHDVWRLEIFLAWAYQIIKYACTEHLTDDAGITRLAWEAAVIKNGALFDARQFRIARARTYGVDPTKLPGGNAMPEPWTASHLVIHNHKRLIEFCYKWLESRPQKPEDKNRAIFTSIKELLPSLTSHYLASLADQAAWAAQSDDPAIVERGKKYQAAHQEEAYSKILRLKDFDLWEEAIELATEHKAFNALAEVVVQQILTIEQTSTQDTKAVSTSDDTPSLAEVKKQRMGKLFDEYEENFAFHAYEVLLQNSGVQAVLDFPYDKNGYATKFLRTKPELAKISWINDIQREDDIDHAAETLLNLGLTREQQVWNKKIELSLGKLALLAEEAEQSVNGDGVSNAPSENWAKNGINLEKIDQELELIKIQDSLYQQILPTIQEAVDDSAALEMAVKEHAVAIPARQKALLTLFEEAMSSLLKHEALQPLALIDLLTLVSLRDIEAIGDQFYLALKVARYGLKSKDRTNAERLIWRRCFIRDDWKAINRTTDKDDLDQLAIVGSTATYHALFAVVDEQHSDEDFQPFIKPSEALGVYTERLDHRFAQMEDDSLCHRLLDEMRWEDKQLQTFIERCRLDDWYQATRDAAEKTVADAYSRLTASKAAKANGVLSIASPRKAKGRGLFGI